MKSITSRDNPKYKGWKQLATSSAARRKQGMSFLDGVHLCEAYLYHRGSPIHCLVSEDTLAHNEIDRVVQVCEARGVDVTSLPRNLYEALSQVEHGVGIAFLIETPVGELKPPYRDSIVLLDAVQDPGNLGSILRSAAAAGCQAVVCGKGSVAAWSPKVLRAGMGAHFVIDVVEDVDLAVLLDELTLPTYATSSHTPHTIYDAHLSQPVVWLFGNEGRGLAADLLQRAEYKITIPHRGEMESLNVASAAAICFFEQVRQQRK